MRPHLAEAVLEDEAFLPTGGLGNLRQPVHEAIAGRRCAHCRSLLAPTKTPTTLLQTKGFAEHARISNEQAHGVAVAGEGGRYLRARI